MLYCPDILQVLVPGEVTKNSTLDVVSVGEAAWSDVCSCRCDDNGNGKQISVNGSAFVYAFHIVFAKRDRIELGTTVRVLDGKTMQVKAHGDVVKNGQTNMLQYSELFL